MTGNYYNKLLVEDEHCLIGGGDHRRLRIIPEKRRGKLRRDANAKPQAVCLARTMLISCNHIHRMQCSASASFSTERKRGRGRERERPDKSDRGNSGKLHLVRSLPEFGWQEVAAGLD